MRIAKLSSLMASILLLAACVTINIYFPAAEAEEAAEKIVDDILGKEGAAPPAEDKGALLQRNIQREFAAAVLDFFIPAAQAAQPDFNVDTPKIRKLQAKMNKRHKSLKSHFSSGGIGYTRDALIGFHDASAISLKSRNKVKKLVSADNKDRNALYRAIADANGHPEWEAEVRATFAKKWVDRAKRGWWYQDSKGRWKQK
jgi:uncharacterized protein YdbL (DUF1318 family)